MKLAGSVHFLRKEIIKEKELTDSQFRLFQLFRRICIWDERNENFGFTDLTTQEMGNYLGWSTGKVSKIRKELIEKKLVIDMKRRRFQYGINNPRIFFSKRVKDMERAFDNLEHEIPDYERKIKEIEQKKAFGMKVFGRASSNSNILYDT